MNKKIVFLDMDGVLADFTKGIGRTNHELEPPEMFKLGFFRNLPVVPKAKWAVEELSKIPNLVLYIGSKHSTNNCYSATEKLHWLEEHFPSLLKNTCLICDKSLLRGDYLIDDNLTLWGNKFSGKFIHFDEYNPEESWTKIVEYFSKTYLLTS